MDSYKELCSALTLFCANDMTTEPPTVCDRVMQLCLECCKAIRERRSLALSSFSIERAVSDVGAYRQFMWNVSSVNHLVAWKLEQKN